MGDRRAALRAHRFRGWPPDAEWVRPRMTSWLKVVFAGKFWLRAMGVHIPHKGLRLAGYCHVGAPDVFTEHSQDEKLAAGKNRNSSHKRSPPDLLHARGVMFDKHNDKEHQANE